MRSLPEALDPYDASIHTPWARVYHVAKLSIRAWESRGWVGAGALEGGWGWPAIQSSIEGGGATSTDMTTLGPVFWDLASLTGLPPRRCFAAVRKSKCMLVVTGPQTHWQGDPESSSGYQFWLVCRPFTC